MESGGVSALIIILLILAGNAIVILSAYGLVNWWRKQAQGAIQKIGETIQGLDSQMNQVAEFLQAYGGIDQEPFFTPLDELQSEASELESRIHQFLNTCRSFEEEIKAPLPNHFQAIVSAPVTWFRRWRRSIELRHESEALGKQMVSSEQRMQNIYELPWELAAECRQASQEVAELARSIQWLQSKGVRGINFQKTASQVPVIQQELNAIPPIYLQGQKEDLLATANLASTVRVFEALSRLRPALNRYLPQAREWRGHLEKASAGYASLKRVGGNLRQALSGPPPGLAVDPLQERLDHVAQRANEVNQSLSQPDADTLKPLAREVSQLAKVLQDTEQQFARAGQQIVELRRLLEERTDGFERLSAQFSALERSAHYPLVGDVSGGGLNEIRQKLLTIGPAQQPRTPEQIGQHRAQIDLLQANFQHLAERIPRVAGQHASLLALLESAEIREGGAWLQKARTALAQAAAYDPRNWPKKETPQALGEALAEVEELQKRLAPPDRTTPVNESGLSEQLKDTQQLAALHKALRPQVESVRLRLEKLRALEEQGKENLTRAWSALEKVALLAESNELLDDVIGDEIDQLGEEIRQAGNELNNHGQGEIEKKAQRIQLLVDRNNQALNQWITRLSAAAAGQARKISQQLSQLDAITRLDEPAAVDARALLQRNEIITIASEPEPAAAQSMVGKVASRITQTETSPMLGDLEALAELKRKSDLWQMLAAAQMALEEKSAALLASHAEITQARGAAQDKLAQVAKNFPEKRVWPPNNQVPLPENQVLHPIDDKWDGIKKKTARADWAVLEMDRLAQQYRLLAERAGQVLNRIEQDHERIQDLEWQVDSLKQRWQSQVVPNNAILREGVQQLLSQTDSKLAYIKQQYMRGTLSYEQCIQNLQLLFDELFSAQVPVDEQNKITLNEPHHPAEQRV